MSADDESGIAALQLVELGMPTPSAGVCECGHKHWLRLEEHDRIFRLQLPALGGAIRHVGFDVAADTPASAAARFCRRNGVASAASALGRSVRRTIADGIAEDLSQSSSAADDENDDDAGDGKGEPLDLGADVGALYAQGGAVQALLLAPGIAPPPPRAVDDCHALLPPAAAADAPGPCACRRRHVVDGAVRDFVAAFASAERGVVLCGWDRGEDPAVSAAPALLRALGLRETDAVACEAVRQALRRANAQALACVPDAEAAAGAGASRSDRTDGDAAERLKKMRAVERREREEKRRECERLRQEIAKDQLERRQREQEMKEARQHSPTLRAASAPSAGARTVIRDGQLVVESSATAPPAASASHSLPDAAQQLPTPEEEAALLNLLGATGKISEQDTAILRSWLLLNREKAVNPPPMSPEGNGHRLDGFDDDHATPPLAQRQQSADAKELKADSSMPIVSVAIRLPSGGRCVLKANTTTRIQELYSHAAWLLSDKGIPAPLGFVLRTSPPGPKVLSAVGQSTVEEEHLAGSAVQIELNK